MINLLLNTLFAFIDYKKAKIQFIVIYNKLLINLLHIDH